MIVIENAKSTRIRVRELHPTSRLPGIPNPPQELHPTAAPEPRPLLPRTNMESTPAPRSTAREHRSGSRPPSRAATPLRRSQSRTAAPRQVSSEAFPLNALEPAFAELAESMGTLQANFQDLQIMHESLSRFNENFASFLYGLNMNAFCIDFPEVPTVESFRRVAEKEEAAAGAGMGGSAHYGDTETTFM